MREEFLEAIPEVDEVSKLDDKFIDIVGKVTLSQNISMELERKLKHANKNKDKIHFREETLSQVQKEREAYEKLVRQTEKYSIENLERDLELY